MNMETGYELNVPVGDGNKDVKAIISNNEVIWERAIPTPKSGVAPLSFRATRAKPLLDWEITGKTYQAWTPSPEPQIGNNKLDNSKIEKSATVTNFAYTDSSVSFGSMTVGSTINSAEIKSEDTSYAFSFTGDTNKVTFALRCYDSSHTYLGDANKIFDEESRAVMTTLANTAYVRLYVTTTVQGNISLTNLMLNKGNTVMAFESFGYLSNTGVCPVQGVGDKTEQLIPFPFLSSLPSKPTFEPQIIKGLTVYADERGVIHIDGTSNADNVDIYIFGGWNATTYNLGVKNLYITCSSNKIRGYVGIYNNSQDAYGFVSSYSKTNIAGNSFVNFIFLRVVESGTTFNNEEIRVMASETGFAEFKPYGYEMSVVNEGDNLLDESAIIKGYYLDNEFTINDVNDTRRRSFSIILNAGTYTLSGENVSFIRSIINGVYNTIGGRDTYTFTITERSKFGVSFRDSESSTTIWTDRPIMLNEGSTALPYTPYREPITTPPIYLNTPLMTDEILKSDGTRDVKWRKYVFTGNETLFKNDTQPNNYLFYTYTSQISSNIKKDTGFCTHLKVVDSAPVDSIGINIKNPFDAVYLNFGKDIMTSQPSGNTIEGLKDYLKSEYNKGTPVTLWYQLATPTTETIDIPTIPTLKGNNVIDTDTEVQPSNLSITYLSSGFEPQPLKTADGQILYTNDNQPLNTLE